MKLIELSPRWTGLSASFCGPVKTEESSIRWGLTFECPHCRTTRLGIFFKPFFDVEDLARLVQWRLPDAPNPNTGEIKEILWHDRFGDTFETLSLSPSINVFDHWHGHIIGGILIP